MLLQLITTSNDSSIIQNLDFQQIGGLKKTVFCEKFYTLELLSNRSDYEKSYIFDHKIFLRRSC